MCTAISNEDEDSRIYADFAHSLRDKYPSTATMFADMAAEESEHRRRLIDLCTERFGDHIPVMLGGGLVLATGIMIGNAG